MAERSVYRKIFWPVLAPSILLGVAAGATVPVRVLAAMQLGASASLAALIVAVVGAIALLTTVRAGRLIDRLGDRRAMGMATAAATALTGVIIAALVLGGRVGLVAFMAATFLEAPAMNIWSLARQAYAAEHVEAHEVGRAMTALGGSQRIGALVGPLLGGLLMLWLPLWSAYALSVVCSVLAVTILNSERGAGDEPPAGRKARGGSDEPSGPLAVDWTRVVLAGIAILTLQFARVGQPVVVQLWGVHSGLAGSTISLLVALGAAIEVVLMFPGGYLKDRLGRATILVACLLVYGSGFLLMVPATRWWGVAGMVLAVVVMGVGNGLGAGVNMTIGADLSPSQGRGRFLGVWAMFTNAGQLGGPLLISALVAGPGVAAAVLAVGGIALAGAGWMVATSRRIDLPRGVSWR